MGDLGTLDALAAAAGDRRRCGCGAWYPSDGDIDHRWIWPDGIWSFAHACKRCARADVERRLLVDTLNELRDWAMTAIDDDAQRVDVAAHIEALVWCPWTYRHPLPAPGFAAYSAWLDLHASHAKQDPRWAPLPEDDPKVPPGPPTPQIASERAAPPRRRRRAPQP